MLIKVTRGATIPRKGLQYANKSVFYSLECEETGEMAESIRDLMSRSLDEKIEQDFIDEGHRPAVIFIRCTKHKGQTFYHVTQIVTPIPPEIPFIDEHAYIGTFIQDPIYRWIQTGQFDTDQEWQPQPNVKDHWHNYAFGAWYKKHGLPNKVGFNSKAIEEEVYNFDHGYKGRYDILGVIGEDLTIFDIKKTKNITGELKEKYLMQLAAYANCIPGIKKLCLISPHKDSKTPIIIEDNIGLYFNKFLEKFEQFKSNYIVEEDN